MSTHLVHKAIEFATKAHEGAERKYDGGDYIQHPLDVMTILLKGLPHVTDEVLAAAVLHDVLEDTEVEPSVLEAEFGSKVLQLVQELTTPKEEGPRWRRKRREALRLGTVSWEAQTIKCADILSNMRDIWLKDPSFAPTYALEKRWALHEMHNAYGPLRDSAWLATFPPKEIK